MNIRDRVRIFIIENLAWQGDAADLSDGLPLIDQRVLDSIQVLTLVQFLEREYAIEILDNEISAAHLGTLSSIEEYVKNKTECRPTGD